MGGLGSGRYEYATTPTVEDCRTLDVNEFSDAVDHPGTSATIRWGPEDDPNASIGVYLLPWGGDVEKATAIRLRYTITDGRTREETEHDYCVPLEYTKCNFGGDRPWFQCPGIVDGEQCERRVAKLYRPPRCALYLCHHCYDLGYTSSRTSGDELKQAELRYRRVYAKLDEQGRGPHPNSDQVPYVPDRPKGMHHETYEALIDELTQARLEWNNAWMERLHQMTQNLERV